MIRKKKEKKISKTLEYLKQKREEEYLNSLKKKKHADLSEDVKEALKWSH